MKPVTVGATCHKTRVSQFLDLPMVTLVIGLGRNEKDLVSFHHFLVGMTLLADLRMELLSKCDHLGIVALQERDLVEAVTVAAGCGVRVAVDHGFPMDALRIAIIGMAGRAGLDDADFIPLPGRQLMNLLVAVFALDFIDEMGAGIVLSRFLLVATMAGHRLRVDFCLFLFNMILDFGDIPVAAVAGVCPMNRLCKLPFVDLFSMTVQTFRVVDALIAVFAALNDELLPLLLSLGRIDPFRGLGNGFLRGSVACPERVKAERKAEKEDEER